MNDLFQAIDNERAIIPRHALVDAAKVRGVVVGQHATEASGHGNILLATDGVADDPTLMSGAVVVVPQLGAAVGIIGMSPRHQATNAASGPRTQTGSGKPGFW